MKVTNQNPSAISSGKIGSQGQADQAANDVRSKASNATTSPAQVEVSQQAKDIQKAMDLAKVENTVDVEKVERLQSLIDRGLYGVDAQSIAERLVDEHFKMPT